MHEWLGNPIKLHLHHIDGNHLNNELSNLQLLCPNCHSFTDNYGVYNSDRYKDNQNAIQTKSNTKRRNELRDNLNTVCPICGGKKSRNAEKCIDCHLKERDRIPVSKDDLLSLILTTSFVEIGRMYEVTDNSVRKWCIKYGLPKTKNEIKTFKEVANNNVAA